MLNVSGKDLCCGMILWGNSSYVCTGIIVSNSLWNGYICLSILSDTGEMLHRVVYPQTNFRVLATEVSCEAHVGNQEEGRDAAGR